MWNDGWGHMGDWSTGWGIFGMVMMVIFWGAVFLLIFYAVRSATASADRPPTDQSRERDRALAILRERYALGEIDQDEYEARRRILEDPLSSM